MVRAGLIALALAGCGVRAPAALDVSALIRERGPAAARDELVIRIADRPKDIQARLGLAALADQLGRPTEAIEQLEAVIALDGPVGTRWHPADRARLARLLAGRGRARLARGAATALADLDRARELGAALAPDDRRRALLLLAIADLRHVDGGVRAAGMRLLAGGVAADLVPVQGIQPAASPEMRARFGIWLWQRGARRAAWDELSGWHDQTPVPRDEAILAAYLIAYAWWTPYDGAPPRVEDLRGPERCRWPALAAGCSTTPPSPPSPPLTMPTPIPYPIAIPVADPALPPPPTPPPAPLHPAGSAADAASVVAYAVARVPAGLPAGELRPLVDAFARDPMVAERMGRDLVASAVDAAVAHASLGALFQALGDPARARTEWQAAVDSSAELSNLRGLAVAIARAHDPDAALLAATTAAAASGDPALVWIAVSRALADVGSGVEALEAARSAIELAGADAIADAFGCAIAASTQLHRDAQADALRVTRDSLPPAAPSTNAELVELPLPAP